MNLGEKVRSYSQELKDQVVRECFETNKYGAVATKHGIPITTIYGWIKSYKNKDRKANLNASKRLHKELADLRLENQILKELLKKSHQLWLKE